MSFDLARLLATEPFTPMDRQFARFLQRLAGGDDPALGLAAALVSRQTGGGHVCLNLEMVAGRPLAEAVPESGAAGVCPGLADWERTLRTSGVVAGPGEFAPLVLDGGRLYLHRYWEYERAVAAALLNRAGDLPPVPDRERFLAGLDRLFPGGIADRQRAAAAVSALRRLCVISGGPGTGKTHTVVRIMALLQDLAAPDHLRIGLAAPTGKAAARLQESVRRTGAGLDLPAEIAAAIPAEAATIHRLLGVRRDSPRFRHHRENPLPFDLLIVDEASMVDLALMAKLLDALAPQARLVLLGDRDQLASVEAGAVLGDICGDRAGGLPAPLAGLGFEGVEMGEGGPLVDHGRYTRGEARDEDIGKRSQGAADARHRPVSYTRVCEQADNKADVVRCDRLPLADCLVLLTDSYRFGPASGIGRLARAVNAGDGDGGLDCLRDGEIEDVTWRPAGDDEELAARVVAGYRSYLEAADPEAAFAAFESFRLLTGLRRGHAGAAGLNEWVERQLAFSGLIDPREREWYKGRPVMVTRNHYGLGLYNGDIGLTLPDEEGNLRVFFPAADGSLRSISPARMPAHETAYVLTVHKSQGSEFDRVLLLLPDRPSPVLTRELLYTAITRARFSFELWGSEAVFLEALAARTRRTSGLGQLLWP